MDSQSVIDIFDLEARSLNALVRTHPQLQPLFTQRFDGVDMDALRRSYLQLLKLSADYTQYTVPGLRAAGLALCDGDTVDQSWSAQFLAYASGETAEDGGEGHNIWAEDDMATLGASGDQIGAPTHPCAIAYGKYFIDDAARHPYAILGAKGVLEHAAVRGADDLARGVAASKILHGDEATRFFESHGVLDIDHVRDGDHNLRLLTDPDKLRQVLEGAYVTSGTYRALLHYFLPA